MLVQSGLGQPLRAEVEVTALGRDELASLGARLAPPESFRQAGLELNAALSGVRFAIERRADGRVFVRMTSVQPINEPFIDMLVELNWSTGKFVREYTFLLDPPELRSGTEQVEGGSIQESTVVAPATAARPQTPPDAGAPRVQAPVARTVPRAAQREPVASAAPPKAAAPSDVQVKPGETLQGIAVRVRPANVQLEQVIVALYQANPSAFFGSIHQLKAGAALSVPDAAAMAAIDARTAAEQIRVQSADFSAYRARLAGAPRTVPGEKSARQASGTVTARVEDKTDSSAKDQLKLSRSAPMAPATGASALKPAEQGVARDAALREQQGRVTELEKNVSDLQRLLELKNRQLAELQKQVDDARAAGKTVAGAVAPAAPGKAELAKAVPATAEPPKAQAPKVEPPKAEAPKAEAAKAEAPKAEPAKAEAPKAETAAPALPAADAPVASAEPPKPAPKAVEPSPTVEPGFLDDLLDSPMLLPGAGAIVAIGAGYGWYAMRRRRKVEKFEDSLIAADGFATNSLFGSTGGQSVDTRNTGFEPGGQDSGVDVHSTEVDPIAEAEVYIAYGREAQAEEILKEALSRQPERQAIRAKLLEIYSGRKDVPAFNALATEMHDLDGGASEDWPKVVGMGLALDPDNPLYSGGNADAAARSAAAELMPTLPQSLAPDSLTPASADEHSGALGPQAAADALPAVDFGDSNEASAQLPTFEMPAHLPTFEDTRPLVDTAAEADAPSSSPLTGESIAQAAMPALNFDIDLDTTIGKAGGLLDADRDKPDSDLERAVGGRFDLPSLDLDLDSHDLPAREEPADKEALDFDLPPLDVIPEASEGSQAPSRAAEGLPAIESERVSTYESAPESPEGIKWQEMATKLDLASAYEEIGDKEGARELLEEVLGGGDAEQQERARSTLARLG